MTFRALNFLSESSTRAFNVALSHISAARPFDAGEGMRRCYRWYVCAQVQCEDVSHGAQYDVLNDRGRREGRTGNPRDIKM